MRDLAPFKAAWDEDAANQRKQPFDEYLKWVERFYEGQRFPPIPGWRKREEDLVRRHAGRDDVRAALAEAGLTLAREWAKDNSVRKVSTGDLQTWGKRFEDAARDGDALVAALRQVEAEVRDRLR